MGVKIGELGRWQIVLRQEVKLLFCTEDFWHRNGDQIFIFKRYFRHQRGNQRGKGRKVVRLEDHKKMGELVAS